MSSDIVAHNGNAVSVEALVQQAAEGAPRNGLVAESWEAHYVSRLRAIASTLSEEDQERFWSHAGEEYRRCDLNELYEEALLARTEAQYELYGDA